MNADEKKEINKEIKDLTGVVVKALPPVKGRKNGGKRGFGSVQDPNVGAATRFKPGHSMPGPGRPKNTPMTDALRKRLLSRLPVKYAKTLGIPKSATWGDAVAWTALYDLLKNPDPDKLEKYAQRTDGPLVTEIRGSQGGPIPLDLDAGPGVTVYEQLRTVTTRLRDRLAKTVEAER